MTIQHNNEVKILPEPSLQFAGNGVATDPHDGLSLFGPFSIGRPEHPQTPAYVVMGTDLGNGMWSEFAARMNGPSALADRFKHHLWSPFPGFDVAFGSPWPQRPSQTFSINRTALLEASRKRDANERCYAVVEQFMCHFETLKKHDAKPAVAICVIPDEVKLNCRPESRVANPVDQGISRQQKESRKAGQFEMFASFNQEEYLLSPDFRRQLKARTMAFDVPVQIVQESTLRLTEPKVGERGLTPLSDRMWNLSTGLYYKCGGKPWRLNSAREGVCYIGIAFRRGEEGGKTACCAAQMFLDSGDGIVFLGEFGPWYSPDEKEFHLTPEAATKLLSGVLKTYGDLDGKALKEIFLHCRSTVSNEEFAGYEKACPAGCKLIGVRVRPDRFGPRLFRTGSVPVMRGTFWQIWPRSGYLYGSGFKPRLGTYDGWETPVPLRIDIEHGDADLEGVATDIFGLTKLNYNACRLGKNQPVTVGFSDEVGEILISNPTVQSRRPNFKYYI